MGYKQPFKKVGKVEPGMKNQSKSGVYQIGAIKSKSIKELEKSAQSATSNLQQAAFPEGGKGLDVTPKPKKSIQFSGNGQSAYGYEFQKAAERIPQLTKKYGEDLDAGKLRGAEMTRVSTDARGMQKGILGKGNILEQKEKFEKQFGQGSSRMFGFVRADLPSSQIYSKKAEAEQQKLSGDMYNTAVDIAKSYQAGTGGVNQLKPKGIDTSLGYQISAPKKQTPKTKRSTSSTRRRQNVLENVGEAIESLNPFKRRFGPTSKAGRQSTGRHWMR